MYIYKRYNKMLGFTSCNVVLLLKFIKNKWLNTVFYTVLDLPYVNVCLYVIIKTN